MRSGPAKHALDFPPQTVNFSSSLGIRRELIDRFTQTNADHKVVSLVHDRATNLGCGLELLKHNFRGAAEHGSTIDDPGHLAAGAKLDGAEMRHRLNRVSNFQIQNRLPALFHAVQ